MCIGQPVATAALLFKEAVLHTSQIMPGTRLAHELQSKAADVCMPQGQKAATASAETLADQLMAEEAEAAARAASKKVKKQKAKAKKQQARSENDTAASSTAAAAAADAAADASADADADVAEDPQASSVATAFGQLGLTHASASPDSAALNAAEVAAMTQADKAEAGLSVSEDQTSNLDADDKFLQDLFRCPITKVSCPLALGMQLDNSMHA